VLIDEIYLEPHARGRGLGGALLAAACDWARGQGAEIARLEVNRHNARARALYLRSGFRDDDRDILSCPLADRSP
jgi:GNAT superfamily N-acetyltransferase